MNDPQSRRSIVVGIDGSQTAINAAVWAIDEAVDREIPLRLVHVIHPDTGTSDLAAVTDDDPLEVEYGEAVLRIAADAVTATGKLVKVETALLCGDASAVLIAESRDADMVCVGSVGIGRFCRAVLGSTAADLAEGAHCAVAIIRAHHDRPRTNGGNWIVVPIDHSPDNDTVVEQAMKEARRRHATVLALGVWHEQGRSTSYDALDRRVQSWRARYPDLRIYEVAAGAGVADFLADNEAWIQLAVIGRADAPEVAQLVGPHAHPILGHVECSVLIVGSLSPVRHE
jgi:nucleotide-binding universal stress UspA family protein